MLLTYHTVDNRFDDLQALRGPELPKPLSAKPASAAAAASGPATQSQVAVRRDFAETWIFDNFEE